MLVTGLPCAPREQPACPEASGSQFLEGRSRSDREDPGSSVHSRHPPGAGLELRALTQEEEASVNGWTQSSLRV